MIPVEARALPSARALPGAQTWAVQAGGITLAVELSGPPGGAPLLLVPGLGMQLTDWPAGLVAELGAAGFCVICADPRDLGLSQPMDDLGRAPVHATVLTQMFGLRSRVPYTLADLAQDAVHLLDALGIGRAHVCGASMGGMVAQHLAASHPQRLRSLTLMMSSSGSPWLPRGHPQVLQQMFSRPPPRAHFDELVAHFARLHRSIGSPNWPEPEQELEARVRTGLLRAYRPQALERQAVAVMADGDRSPLLRHITAPTAVIHGGADPLVPPAAGRDLAKRIQGAVLDEIPGMGHDFPEALWPRFVADLLSVARRAAAPG